MRTFSSVTSPIIRIPGIDLYSENADMCSCPVCWNSVRGLLQSGHNENFNTEFENILKVVLPYIVLVDNKSAIFCRKHGKA